MKGFRTGMIESVRVDVGMSAMVNAKLEKGAVARTTTLGYHICTGARF
jgi:hypothetical protein